MTDSERLDLMIKGISEVILPRFDYIDRRFDVVDQKLDSIETDVAVIKEFILNSCKVCDDKIRKESH